ncbi:MAG: hypothetical protein HY908_08065 [Myxococcales bacterium]|nr:hypothetical protein [Myxococcales bacterium]
MSSASPPTGSRQRAPDAPRGLPSIAEARAARGRMRWFPPKFWAAAAVLLGASVVVWWKLDSDKLQRARNELLTRQRETAAELAPKWLPLRDKIEAWTVACAGEHKELIELEVGKAWDFRNLDGLYLRLGKVHAGDAEAVRKATKESLHDAFTACLWTGANPSPLAGPACETSRNCEVRQFCNEFEHCAEYAQPYNVSLAYRTMKVLSTEWVEEVQGISDKLILRAALATYDDAVQFDSPVAVDLLARAKYFMAVVDEPADEGEEPEPETADAGTRTTRDVRGIPSGAHMARVCVWRLEDEKPMLAIRREAAGSLEGPGAALADAKSRRALQMQANSCALAVAVRSAIGDVKGDLPLQRR